MAEVSTGANERIGEQLKDLTRGIDLQTAFDNIPVPDEVAGWEDITPVPSNGQIAYANERTGQAWFPDGYIHPTFTPERMTAPAAVMAFARAQKRQNDKARNEEAISKKEAARKAAQEKHKPKTEPTMSDSTTASDIVDQTIAPLIEPSVDAEASDSKTAFELPSQDSSNAFQMPESSVPPVSVSSEELKSQVPKQSTAPAQSQSPNAFAIPPDLNAGSQPGFTLPPQQPSQQMPMIPAAQGQPTMASVIAEDNIPEKQKTERYWENTLKSEVKAARARNARAGADIDPAAFQQWPGKIADYFYETIGGGGRKFKDHINLWNQMDRFTNAFMIGFFHIKGEHFREGKNGSQWVEYPAIVKDRIKQVREMFGLEDTIRGRRTVFRMAMLYASMSIDRHGKLFNQNPGEWEMTVDEFSMICDLMMRSADKNNGNPFCIVDPGAKLGGTDIYPSGVIPKVVAAEICNSRSVLKDMTPNDFVEACKQQWKTKTYPKMITELVNKPESKKKKKGEDEQSEANLYGQRVVIEGMQQALARIDGLTSEQFSTEYGVDTSDYFTLEELKEEGREYAAAMNGNFDSKAVARRNEAKLEAWMDHLDKYGRAPALSMKIGSRTFKINTMWSARFAVTCIRTNALFLNAPVAVGMYAEHGLSNLTTLATLSVASKDFKEDGSYAITPEAREYMTTKEMLEAMYCLKMLMDTYGPGAVREFSTEYRHHGGFTIGNVTDYINKRLTPDTPSELKKKVEMFLNKHVRRLIAGDYFFKKSDNMNFYRGLLIHNAAASRSQSDLAKQHKGKSKMGIALTPEELENTMKANQDAASWLADIMADDMGIDAYLMMRGNNIADINPVSFTVKTVLAQHGIGNVAITALIDNFPEYGVNLAWHMLPFTKTFMYIFTKRPNNKNIAWQSDLLIGGNLGHWEEGLSLKEALDNDPGFREGLKLNLVYDAVTFARFGFVTPLLIAVILLACGWDEPEDKLSLSDPAAWRVGGQELNDAFWVNDLVLFGLPLGLFFATLISTDFDRKKAGDVFINSLEHTMEGNVLLDTANFLKNWQDDLAEIQQLMESPEYEGKQDVLPSATALLLEEYILSVVNKLTPGAPLYRNISNSALLTGDQARAFSPYKEWDRSSEWAIENGITHYIDDPREVIERKAAAANPLIAGILELTRNIMSPDSDKKTSYAWWGMPPKTIADPTSLTWAGVLDFDYSKRGDLTEAEYEYLKTQELIALINSGEFSGPRDAASQGFYLPNEYRYAAENVIYAEINYLRWNLAKRQASGEFAYDNEAKWREINRTNAIISEMRKFMNTWLKSDDIPTYYEYYEQLKTSYEHRYYWTETNEPATWVDFSLHPDLVTKEYFPKGDHPNNIFPFTVVDHNNRGYNAETLPYWQNENTDLEAYRNGIGKETVPYGRFEGEVLNDVTFGGDQPEGYPEYTNPEQGTIGIRSYVGKPAEISDDVREFSNYDSNGSIYGELGIMTKEQEKLINKINNGESVSPSELRGAFSDSSYGLASGISSGGNPPDIYGNGSSSDGSSQDGSGTPAPVTYPGGLASFFESLITDDEGWPETTGSSGYGYGYSGGSGGGGSSPRIYSTSRSVNADRPSTMYSKNPQSPRTTYLNPSFETKGSREAYKRQDI